MGDATAKEKPQQFESIGGLWIKKRTIKGVRRDFFYGFLTLPTGNQIKIHILINTHKRAHNHPDYHIFRSTDAPRKGKKPEKKEE